MILTFIATCVWGLILPPSSVVFAAALFLGVSASTFLPVYLMGLFWKGATRTGAMASMAGGLGMNLVWMVFFHYQESAALGVCAILFGRVNVPAIAVPNSPLWLVQYVAPIVIALPVAFTLGIWVSRKTRKPSREHLNRCFKFLKK
jgi:SSS family solute:Na+ symporter